MCKQCEKISDPDFKSATHGYVGAVVATTNKRIEATKADGISNGLLPITADDVQIQTAVTTHNTVQLPGK